MLDLEARDLITDIVRSATEPNLWPEICERMERRLNANIALVFEFDLTNFTVPIFHGPPKIHSDEKIKRLADNFRNGRVGRDGEAAEKLAQKMRQTFYTEHEVYDLDAHDPLPVDPVREEVMSAIGTHSRTMARINPTGRWLDVLSIHMPDKPWEIKDSLRRDVEFFVPVFAVALESKRMLEAIRTRFGALLEFFNALEFGAAFIDEHGNLLERNQVFDDLIQERDAVQFADGTFSAVDPKSNVSLWSAIDIAHAPERGSRRSTTLLKRRSNRTSLVAFATPISGKFNSNSSSPIVLVALVDPSQRSQLPTDALNIIGSLTSSEAEVCRALVDGLSTGEISERRDTSIETTRTQVKSIASKLGCQTRLDVLRMAFSTAVPIKRE